MMEAEIMRIRKMKDSTDFNREFIERVDREWQEIIQLFGRCKYDLSKIRIVNDKGII